MSKITNWVRVTSKKPIYNVSNSKGRITGSFILESDTSMYFSFAPNPEDKKIPKCCKIIVPKAWQKVFI